MSVIPENARAFEGAVSATVRAGELSRLAGFAAPGRRLFVLTGAGCSTGSGIPDYRDELGGWKRRPPIQLRDFLHSVRGRRRYWARSMVGWARVSRAEPNDAHRALAELERRGRVATVVTQNVDGLHQRAGSRRVIDLHGRLDRVECLDCGGVMSRPDYQSALVAANPEWVWLDAQTAPDGDADLDGADYERFRVPPCHGCGGLIKPSVVFFGEAVPRPRVDTALERLAQADAVLVVGSSLMVWSGYRFVRAAHRLGLPVAAINLGRTRADQELALRVAQPCDVALKALLAAR